MSRLCLVLLLLLSAGSLAAQTVVRPDPPLDAERLKVRDAVLVLRDSLNSIDAAAARLQRDFRTASGASLVSRARVMREACARSARTIPPTRQVVAAAPASNENRMKRRDELARGLESAEGCPEVLRRRVCRHEPGGTGREGARIRQRPRPPGPDGASGIRPHGKPVSVGYGHQGGPTGGRAETFSGLAAAGPVPRHPESYVDSHVHIVWKERVGCTVEAS